MINYTQLCKSSNELTKVSLSSNCKSRGVGLGYQFFLGYISSINHFLQSCDEDAKVNLLICNLSINCDSKLSMFDKSIKFVS